MKTVKLISRNKERIFSILIYLVLFLFLIYPYSDYDWGWHYRYGEYLFKTGHLLRQDIFSWTMAGFSWINHSWLYDPIMYLIFKNFSFLGLSLAGSVAAFLAFYIGVSAYRLSFWQKGILAIFFSWLVSGVLWEGLRSQVLEFILLSTLMYLLIKISNLKSQISNLKSAWPFFALPLLILLWVNLHGSFILGMLIFGAFVASALIVTVLIPQGKAYLYQKVFLQKVFIPKSLIFFLASFFVSILFTFINPFTYLVYSQALLYFRNPSLTYILEWVPVQFPSPFYNVFIVYTLFLVFGFVKRRKISDLPLIITTIAVFYLAFGARRFMATYIIVTLPFAALILKDLNLALDKFRATSFVFLIAIAISLEIGIFRRIPPFNLFSYTIKDYCNWSSNCSEDLTNYLLKNPPKGRGFNFYDWGGYLIGRGVKAKLFIDGRMDLWKRSNGYQPFMEFQKMYYEGDFAKFNKYNFDWVIAQPNSIIAKKLKTKDLGNWDVKYEDGRAVYLVREK